MAENLGASFSIDVNKSKSRTENRKCDKGERLQSGGGVEQ